MQRKNSTAAQRLYPGASSLVNYIQLQVFKLEDWNVYDRHGELAMNEKLLPSFGSSCIYDYTKFVLLSKVLPDGLTVMCKYT